MKSKRQIKWVFVHCTGTRPDASVKSIVEGFRHRGWQNPGYHFLVDTHGIIHTLLHPDEIANGVRGYNRNSIHIAYIGGIDSNGRPSDTRTVQQTNSLRAAVRVLMADNPGAQLLGHRDIWPRGQWKKECPCFEVSTL